MHAWSTKHAQPSDLVELAKEVQRANEEVKHTASGKLQIIVEQIRFLQEQVNICVLFNEPLTAKDLQF